MVLFNEGYQTKSGQNEIGFSNVLPDLTMVH